MPSSRLRQPDRAARDERAADRDDDATGRDTTAGGRDDTADARDTTAAGRHEEFLDGEIQLRQRLSAAERRHAAEDDRRAAIAREARPTYGRTAEQAEIDREVRRSERAMDAADLVELRDVMDRLHTALVDDGTRDRLAAAKDRADSRADRHAAAEDRTRAGADREQSGVDHARYE